MSASFDYSGIKATAQRLIRKFGRSATLARPSRVPDPGKPWLTQQGSGATVAAQSFTVQVVEAGIQGVETGWFHRELETVKTGERAYLISTETELPEEIDTDWYLTDQGVNWQVLSVRRIEPGPELLLYRLRVQA